MSPYPPCVPTMEDKLGLCDINGVTIAVLALRSQLLSQKELRACHLHCPLTAAQLPLGASWLQRERVSQSAQPHTPAHTPSRLLLPLPIKVFILLKDLLSPLGPQAACFSLHLREHLCRCLQPSEASPALPPLCFFPTQLTSHKTETNMQKALCVLIRFGGKYV